MPIASCTSPPSDAADGGDVTVLIVDDSAVIRGMTRRWLEENPAVRVVGSVGDGAQAIVMARDKRPDVVILDVEMPRMDGMTALPEILAVDRDIKVVMSSTLTQRNADLSLRALSIGAADYIAKPSSREKLHGEAGFRQELVEKVLALGRSRKSRPRGDARAVSGIDPRSEVRARPEGKLYGKAPILLRKQAVMTPEVIAIGSSTGGPQALMTVLAALRGKLDLPVVITQHMPETFTAMLAQHIERRAGWPCREGEDGMALERGKAIIAPGGRHMTVGTSGGRPVVRINDDPPENFCRPSVDQLYRSLAESHGSRVLAIVLTGMGHDGVAGGQALVKKGATIVAQDEATSVVWGMPGAVATGGLCSAVAPIQEIADLAVRIASGRLL